VRRRAIAAAASAAGFVLLTAAPADAATPVSGNLRTNTYSCSLSFAGRSVKGPCSVHDGEYDGLGVYLQIKGIRNSYWDTDWDRLTENVPGGYPHTAYYDIDWTASSIAPKVDTWKIRVCLEVRYQDDPCGGTSSVNV
jgi:hypothetical protein